MLNNIELQNKFSSLWPHLDERAKRLFAASEARQYGYGGITAISQACGLSRVTITKALAELDAVPIQAGRIRQTGGGRTSLVEKNPELKETLEQLVEPLSRGNPESPLRWTCKSTRFLAEEMKKRNQPLSHEKVAQLLRSMDYSLQSNRKTLEGNDHPDRDAQFKYINSTVTNALAQGQPVISVDTKKKEMLGNYINKGRGWRPAKTPIKVNGHDFPDPTVPKAYPYGIYDLSKNTGFVNIGTDHDTAAFAVASIKGWWRAEGRKIYHKADSLYITADGGGSNGYRLRLWKYKIQSLADFISIPITVCHFPPGTSKWNKVEHRLFSFISSNWRGEPLLDYETIVNLIAGTTTAKGLKVTCRLDRRKYPIGKKISNEEFSAINIKPHDFHGEWNYCILPKAN